MKEEFNFTKKIEDMTEEQLKERIKKGYEHVMKNKIFPIPYLGTDEVIEYVYPELVGLCPATGYLDLYTLTIRFIPNKVIPELRSLKLYLMEYKDLPVSHEHIIDKIYKEFIKIVKPKAIEMILQTAVRGGITTTIVKGDLQNELLEQC